MVVNSVSFEARRTFFPGWNLVPRWITMIVPARTNSPPNRFTPRYFGFESRPLREEPTPFLCAIRSSADLHVGDLDLGEILPVPSVTAIARAAREPEDPNLLALAVPHDLGRDLRALHLRRAGRDMLAVARDEHVVERDLVARLRVEQRHLDGDSGLGPELGATGGEDRV